MNRVIEIVVLGGTYFNILTKEKAIYFSIES